MANNRQVKRTIRQLQRVKTWQLLVLLLLMVFVSATFLRLNNIGMAERRESVLAADESGDSIAIENRLYELQRYTTQHMNSDTGPFYLEGQYRRNAQQVVDEAIQSDTSGPNINALAEAACRPQFSSWSPAYVQCFADELAKFPPSEDPVQNITLPSTELYRYNFASPLWSPDFAGFAVLVCAVILLMIFGRMASLLLLRWLVKRQYNEI